MTGDLNITRSRCYESREWLTVAFALIVVTTVAALFASADWGGWPIGGASSSGRLLVVPMLLPVVVGIKTLEWRDG